MKAWAVVEPGAPLELLDLPTPVPQGSEVLVEVTHCGVCHSDLHFWKGGYDLGGGKTLRLADRGVELPRAPGHEVAGRVVAVGPEAAGVAVGGVAVGDVRVVYPWIGCGTCPACLREEDNLCPAQQSIGIVRHGGFASHVVVPHPRYLVDPGDLDLALACTYACSGLTTHAAVTKIMPLAPDQPVVLIGAGGVGLAGIAMLRAFGHRAIYSVDISPQKRGLAEAAGAIAVEGGEGAAQRILAATGGPVPAVIDFVNGPATAQTALDVLAKGGRLVPIGIAGGGLEISLAAFIFRAISIVGSNTGSLHDLRAVIRLAQEGKLAPTPVHTCAKDQAWPALMALKAGQVEGRTVLVG